MSLKDLASQVRQIKEQDKAQTLDWYECAYLVLRDAFDVEPSHEEIVELAREAKPQSEPAGDFFKEWEGGECPHEYQTGGGRRVVHKSEPLGG